MAPSHYLNQCWNIVNWTLGNKLQWNLIEIQTFSLKKIRLKMLSAKCCSFCLSLNVLILCLHMVCRWTTQIARFMGPTWDPPGANRTQVGPCWPHEPCYQGRHQQTPWFQCGSKWQYMKYWIFDAKISVNNRLVYSTFIVADMCRDICQWVTGLNISF